MKHITQKEIFRLRKLRKIFENTDNDLLIQDYKNLPEHKWLIEKELIKRGLIEKVI